MKWEMWPWCGFPLPRSLTAPSWQQEGHTAEVLGDLLHKLEGASCHQAPS